MLREKEQGEDEEGSSKEEIVHQEMKNGEREEQSWRKKVHKKITVKRKKVRIICLDINNNKAAEKARICATFQVKNAAQFFFC